MCRIVEEIVEKERAEYGREIALKMIADGLEPIPIDLQNKSRSGIIGI